ncbi:MAG: hypothetical protein IJY25_03020 [Bacilli bacterium]|nr:hypothetical protein [Bacilli bacterium]
MKKKIFIIMILLLLTGCSQQDNIDNNISEQIEKVEEVKNEYVDDNPITIGIYEKDINLVKEIELIKESGREIILSFYYTNKENLENNKQKENWYKYFSEYNNIDDYKIGFNFSFYVGETKIEKTILKPETFAFGPYFYIYIYDDINQPENTFYSHLEETDINENTIFSSIKIFLVEPSNITSPIKFTVFTYDGMDDFDENNNYRGNSKYEINVDLI